MRFWTTIALILVLSAVGLLYEIAAGRVLAPFFGTSLITWTAVIATVLAGFSLGSALGGLVAERERVSALRAVRLALVAMAVLAALSPTVLAIVYAGGARGTGGMLLAVAIAFGPASVLVSMPSALLAKMAVEARPGREGSSLGLVLAAGSLGAIAGAVLAGFVTLPLLGSVATFAGCGLVTLICAACLPRAPGEMTDARSRARSSAAFLLAGAFVALAAGGGRACQYESGLSCIDVVRGNGAVHLLSDRGWQAGERGEDLVLPYTRWIWAGLDRDAARWTEGADEGGAVLFIGGGGYTLPSRLLTAHPAARAVAVEIDPLITEVVREHLPWAGGVIERLGGTGGEGRLEIVHADGRVYLNETDRTFDAAVLDAFSSGSVPAHLVTRETFERLGAIVRGPVYVNLIDAPNGPLARGVAATMRTVWPHVEAVRGPLGATGRTNTVLRAAHAPADAPIALPEGYGSARLGSADVFTDDRGWVGHR